MFQYLKDEGYPFLIAGMHVKGQVIDSKASPVGATAARPSAAATGSTARSPREPGRPRQRVEQADRVCVNTNSRAPPGTTRSPTCRTAPSTGSTTSSPPARLLDMDFATTPLIVEHEYPRRGCRTRTSSADPAGLDGLHPPHRPGRSRHVFTCRTRCWPRRASPSRVSAARPTGADDMTEFFTDVPSPVALRFRAGGGAGLGYRVYDPDRIVAGQAHGGPAADRGLLLAQLQLAGQATSSVTAPSIARGSTARPTRWRAPFTKQDAAFEFFEKLGVPSTASTTSTWHRRAPA